VPMGPKTKEVGSLRLDGASRVFSLAPGHSSWLPGVPGGKVDDA
jgi:hypothetical protein